MAYRCPDCKKFCATEIEVDSTEAHDFNPEDGIIMLRLSVNKNCAECGATVATGEIELELAVPEETWAAALKNTEFEAS